MCGRYKLTVPFREIVRLYNLTNSVNLPARYNIAPTQDVLAVIYDAETKQRRGEMMRWGLVPRWAKDVKIGYHLINAKAETVAEKPAYREAFKTRRCIIPADAFYEWQETGQSLKQPYAIVMKDRSIFGFAGLWENWIDKASGEVIRSCTIITTEPNALLAPIHNRMPAILAPENYAKWLGRMPATVNQLRAMLRPYPAREMEAFKIGPRIGNVKNDDASLVEPVT
ncbi:MAG TPA: SOS response-associated peptidase [Stellaceae bacterium]|nr:SOS response-associated peptidase [Stellaceae bacterium]